LVGFGDADRERSYPPAITIAQYVRPLAVLFALATPTFDAPCNRRFLALTNQSIDEEFSKNCRDLPE
jgi:hypothetical protein